MSDAYQVVRLAIIRATQRHGGHNRAALALGIDPGHLTRLRDGRAWPSTIILDKLGLEIVEQDREDQVDGGLTRKEWQFLLNCMHPDRAPEDRRERFAQAFDTVYRKLKPRR